MSFLIRSFLFGFILLLLLSCASQSGKKEKERLIVKKVFINGLPDPYNGYTPDYRLDYYYVYNYMDGDYVLFEKMLDTLFVDTAYKYHNHVFIRHELSYDLPDTMAFKNPTHNAEGMELGSGKYKDHYILSFGYAKHHISQRHEGEELRIPDSYSIRTYENDRWNKKYYLKDSISGRLMEVEKDSLYPYLKLSY